MRILSVSEMRSWEAAADEAGHTFDRMMALAGAGVARAIIERTTVKNRRILVLVGPGNNGGDGLVAARYLADAGGKVTAYLARSRDAGQDPVFAKALEHNVTVIQREDDADGQELQRLVARTHILVDSLLGTGAAPPLRGAIAEILGQAGAALRANNQTPLITLGNVARFDAPGAMTVAVDGPSGMDFDAGDVAPETLHADLTVTFAAPKTGHFRFPAADHLGELIVADIGIPPAVSPAGEGPEVATAGDVRAWLPRRANDSHKGSFGKALIVAGSANYTGAAALAAMGAVRAGAGLVTLALAGPLHAAVVPLVPEATYLLLPSSLGAITTDALSLLTERMTAYDALLIGPGLSQTEETTAFIQAFFGDPQTQRSTGFITRPLPAAVKRNFPPLVIDADALNLLSRIPDWWRQLPQESIITPHPGEMARLTGKTTADIQASRWETATRAAAKWGHIVVLKGAHTVIAGPEGRIMVLPFANAGLATAGAGDVLAGAIVALRAQGLGAFESAAAGAFLHGLAGELAAERRGKAGMAAGDVAPALADALKRLGR
ncbi:MAG: NAD(P)H-hydrate dehydratase [Anaerolineae bacterium]|nr:NAD(P)H-hydrate dehydratase [Anaerolineae bacterium]